MVDSGGVAVLDGIQDLEESVLGHGIVPDILALLGDVGEEIAFGAVFNDNVCAVWGVHDLYQRHDVGVGAGLVVEMNLALLELALARLQTNLVECLYGIGDVCLNVHGCVHDSVGSNSKDSGQLETSSKDLA